MRCADRAFFNAEGICQLVSVDCNTYDELTGLCTSCYAGFGLDNGICSKSTQSSGCLERDQNGVCIRCSFRSYLSDANECVSVDDQCADFNYDDKVCIGCYSGYSLLNDKCQITQVDEDKEIENCFAYTPEGNCLECFDRFYLSEANVCAEVDIFCKGYEKATGDCTSCYEGLGFSLKEGKCVQ